MNKKLLVVLVVLVLSLLFVGVAVADRGSDAWTKVHHSIIGQYQNMKVNPNGVVHSMYDCDADYLNCPAKAVLWPFSKFPEPPELDEDDVCDQFVLFGVPDFILAGGEQAGDEGDMGDFIAPLPEIYWLCDTWEGNHEFRFTGE